MTQIEDIITNALGLKASLNRLYLARRKGYAPQPAALVRLENIIVTIATHEALAEQSMFDVTET